MFCLYMCLAIDYRLQWHQRNQETIFGGTENLKAYKSHGKEQVAADTRGPISTLGTVLSPG